MLDKLTERAVVPNCVMYNTLIDGYCKTGELEEAVGLREKNGKPNVVTFNSLLSGFF